jgi:hypothetical protein
VVSLPGDTNSQVINLRVIAQLALTYPSNGNCQIDRLVTLGEVVSLTTHLAKMMIDFLQAFSYGFLLRRLLALGWQKKNQTTYEQRGTANDQR